MKENDELNELLIKVQEVDKDSKLLSLVTEGIKSDKYVLTVFVEFENDGFIQFKDEKSVTDEFKKYLTEVDLDYNDMFDLEGFEDGEFDDNKKVYKCYRWISKGQGIVSKEASLLLLKHFYNENDFYSTQNSYDVEGETSFQLKSIIKSNYPEFNTNELKTLEEFSSWYFYADCDDGWSYLSSHFFRDDFVKCDEVIIENLYKDQNLSWVNNEVMNSQNFGFRLLPKNNSEN
ncbi:MAG: hypothetical protein HWE24_20970 [Oceanospirillaceae bacterium]|nr:hypothetical protein [Oceanospirillaceae bacterium]